MAGTPETIVLDPAKPQLERAEATQIRAKMLQESLGSAGKNIMDIVTQYQGLKEQKQKQDLATMTMAGTLSGGMDKLPQDAKNKLPGILGVNLPTDEQGNVQVTPDTDTVIKRMTLDMLQKDPNAFRVAAGIRQKEEDPGKMANDLELKKMQVASDREKDTAAAQRNQATNSTNIDRALIEGRTRLEAAHIGADAKGAADRAPSPYVLDPNTNTMMTEPQWYSTYPGKQIPAKLSFKDADTINKTLNTQTAAEARNASVKANEARIRSLDVRTNNILANPDPNDLQGKQLKKLMDGVRLSRGTAQEAGMNAFVADQMPKLLKSWGYSDADITAMTTAAGQGGWPAYLLNKWNSAMGLTDPYNMPSLTQADTDHIHGVSPTPPAPAGTSKTTTGTMSYDDWAKQNPRQ